MVTFRFYLVSLVAFFLALAVGVVLGSALDGRISASLKDRLERVESNLDSTVDLIDQKNDQISSLEKYSDASIPFAVEGRLAGTATLIVAQSGVNADQLADVVAAVRQAGSSTPGVLWVDKSWDPNSREFIARVEKSFGKTKETLTRENVESYIWEGVLTELGAILPSSDDTTATTAPTTSIGETTIVEPDPNATPPTTDVPVSTILAPSTWWEQPLLKQLAENSVLRLQTIGQGSSDEVSGPLNVIAVIGSESDVESRNSDISSLGKEAVRVGLATLIGEANPVGDESSAKDSVLKSLLDEIDSESLSTVQSIEEPAGRVATVVALQRAAEGQFGRFGRGSLAASLLPAPPAPDDGS